MVQFETVIMQVSNQSAIFRMTALMDNQHQICHLYVTSKYFTWPLDNYNNVQHSGKATHLWPTDFTSLLYNRIITIHVPNDKVSEHNAFHWWRQTTLDQTVTPGWIPSISVNCLKCHVWLMKGKKKRINCSTISILWQITFNSHAAWEESILYVFTPVRWNH